MAMARSRPASDATVPVSVTTLSVVLTLMWLCFSASSPTNFAFTLVVIHESATTSPVFFAAFLVSCAATPTPSAVFSPAFSTPFFVSRAATSAPRFVSPAATPTPSAVLFAAFSAPDCAFAATSEGRCTVIWFSTRVTPSILARRAARLLSAAVGTSPVSVATPAATDTSMSASFSVASASHFFSIRSSS